MEKKKYIAPECIVIEMEPETLIAASGELDLGYGGSEDDVELQSNRHRGEWGNLWSDRK